MRKLINLLSIDVRQVLSRDLYTDPSYAIYNSINPLAPPHLLIDRSLLLERGGLKDGFVPESPASFEEESLLHEGGGLKDGLAPESPASFEEEKQFNWGTYLCLFSYSLCLLCLCY